MFHLTLGNTKFNTAILIKEAALQEQAIRTEYIEPMDSMGIDTSGMLAFSLTYDGKKPSATCRKEYLAKLLPSLVQLGIHTLMVCDAEYFKSLTGLGKADPHLGYMHPCKVKGFEDLKVVYGISHQAFFYNPDNRERMKLVFDAVLKLQKESYTEIGADVLKDVKYLSKPEEIEAELEKLLAEPVLAADIEAFSLKHYDAGIGTISFSKDEHTAVVFAVDAQACEPYELDVWDKKDKKFKRKVAHIREVKAPLIRALLRWFMTYYTGKLIWHNAAYDVTVLIYQLWMKSIIDREGLLKGLDIMMKHTHCSQLVTYLAVNSSAGNNLGLKDQAHEFAGNYAIEVKDIRLQPLPTLLEYNAIDTCSTMYVWNKNYPIMVRDEQEPVYLNHFREYLTDVIDMQLTGMCIDLDEVDVAEEELTKVRDASLQKLLDSDAMVQAMDAHRQKLWEQDFEGRKAKAKNPENIKPKELSHFDDVQFNPDSPLQLQGFLYETLGLPVIDRTKTKQPATGTKVLEKLVKLVSDETQIEILNALIDYKGVSKILSAFIPAFREAQLAPDGYHYLFGSFKLGGTVSGRLSASSPNFQQIPSGSTYAKHIKRCFKAPRGSLFAGSDFNALEDVVNTLLTKDPNKVKVLVDGFDGHMFRCMNFWPEKFVGVDLNNPDEVNGYKELDWADKMRSKGKPVHFSQQYQGTWKTLMSACGFPEDEARTIEQNYRNLYKVSFDWVAAGIAKASTQGYAIAAFGLRIRTPLLNQVVLGNRNTPFEAEAEARTLGNAISGQSYGLLNNRAACEFMERVRTSKYRLDIRMCAQIHDAIYLRVTDSLEVLEWVNNNLIECMKWQDLPELQHESIRLGSELDIFYPTWADDFTLPNNASQAELVEVITSEVTKRKEKK